VLSVVKVERAKACGQATSFKAVDPQGPSNVVAKWQLLDVFRQQQACCMLADVLLLLDIV
jgi:hypothetical protein